MQWVRQLIIWKYGAARSVPGTDLYGFDGLTYGKTIKTGYTNELPHTVESLEEIIASELSWDLPCSCDENNFHLTFNGETYTNQYGNSIEEFKQFLAYVVKTTMIP